MSLVISRDLVLIEQEDLTNRPLIGWRNIVTASNIAADSAEALYPAVNLANPATHLRWQATSNAEQYLTITTGTADSIDYIGIARHNLASGEIPVSIEGNDGSGFEEIVQDVVLPNDGPALFRFISQPYESLRIRLWAGVDPATMSVVYAGKLLALERKIYQGHTPLPFAPVSKATNGKSESGQFLGRIVTGESLATKLPLSLITPEWFRANLAPFLAPYTGGKNRPFFFAWRPDDYPAEVGYAWLTNDPQPTPQSPHSYTSLTFEMGGIAS